MSEENIKVAVRVFDYLFYDSKAARSRLTRQKKRNSKFTNSQDYGLFISRQNGRLKRNCFLPNKFSDSLMFF